MLKSFNFGKNPINSYEQGSTGQRGPVGPKGQKVRKIHGAHMQIFLCFSYLLLIVVHMATDFVLTLYVAGCS